MLASLLSAHLSQVVLPVCTATSSKLHSRQKLGALVFHSVPYLPLGQPTQTLPSSLCPASQEMQPDLSPSTVLSMAHFLHEEESIEFFVFVYSPCWHCLQET
jgi:hypothetical protein